MSPCLKSIYDWNQAFDSRRSVQRMSQYFWQAHVFFACALGVEGVYIELVMKNTIHRIKVLMHDNGQNNGIAL